MSLIEQMREAVFTVLEGFTIPHDVRKILETAYYAALTQPAEGGEVLGLSCGEACKLVEQLCTNLNEYHCAKHQDYRDLFNTRATECEGKLKDLLRALYTAPPASQEQAQQPSGIKSDFGPWSVSMDGQYIDSDDFEHDVKLIVRGDFRDDVQRRLYACDIAKRLSQQPSGGEVVAWMYDFAIDGEVLRNWTTSDYSEIESHKPQVLNVRPLTLATPKPEPLTEAEARDLLEAEFLGGPGERNLQDDIRVIRLAEAHHGITKGEA